MHDCIGKPELESESKYFRKLLLEVYNIPDLEPKVAFVKEATKFFERLDLSKVIRTDIQKLLILLFQRVKAKEAANGKARHS